MSIEAVSVQNNATLNSLDEELNSLGFSDKFSDWMGNKGKYASEFFSRICFPFANLNIPGVDRAGFQRAEGYFKMGKDILALSSVVKGSLKLAEKAVAAASEIKVRDFAAQFFHPIQLTSSIWDKKTQVRNLAGEICYVMGDAYDSLKGFTAKFQYKNEQNAWVDGKIIDSAELEKFLNKTSVKIIKDLCGIIGLSNSVYNLQVDIEKLKKANVVVSNKKEIASKDLLAAEECKQRLVSATIDNKWWDIQRDVSAIASCVLSVTQTATGFGVPGANWIFWTFGMSGLVGKAKMHMAGLEAKVYKEQLVKRNAKVAVS